MKNPTDKNLFNQIIDRIKNNIVLVIILLVFGGLGWIVSAIKDVDYVTQKVKYWFSDREEKDSVNIIEKNAGYEVPVPVKVPSQKKEKVACKVIFPTSMTSARLKTVPKAVVIQSGMISSTVMLEVGMEYELILKNENKEINDSVTGGVSRKKIKDDL